MSPRLRLAVTAGLAVLLLGTLAVRLREPRGRPASAGDGRSRASPAASTAAIAPPPARLPIRFPSPPPAPAPDAPPASARFEGRVLDADTGGGVAGAELTFSRGGVAAATRTDAGGAFRFDPPTSGRWLLAAVVADGYLPFAPEWGHSPVQLDAAPGADVRGIELHLAPAAPLDGRVVDGEGAPVPGAEVRLLGAAGEAALVPIPDRFTTDAHGRFRAAAPDGAVLEARRAGFAPGRAPVDWVARTTGRITVVLGPERADAPAGRITGRVQAPGGEPIPGALVVAERSWGPDVDAPSAQALSDARGRFALEDLEPDRYLVTARADGRAPARTRAATGDDVVLELPAGGQLRGCVRDAGTGAAVAPFTVAVLERRSALRLVPQRSLSVLDGTGCYAVDDLLPGPAVVIFSAPGHAASEPRDVIIPPPPAEAIADAALEVGARLSGVVVDDATGAPLSRARVSVEGSLAGAASTFPVLSEATTGPDGVFVLSGLPRRCSLFVAAPDHDGRVVGGLDLPSGASAGPVTVRLRRPPDGADPRVELAGIGAVLTPLGDDLAITSVVAGGGAAEAGLLRGDLIVAVDGRPVAELGFGGAVEAIRGPEGTSVVLECRRGTRTLEVRVERRLVRG